MLLLLDSGVCVRDQMRDALEGKHSLPEAPSSLSALPELTGPVRALPALAGSVHGESGAFPVPRGALSIALSRFRF